MSAAKFWNELQDGRLGLPICPAAVQDVYAGYLLWCRRCGYSTSDPLKSFVVHFMRVAQLRRITSRIPDQQAGVHRRRRVLLMGKSLPEFWRERHRIVFGVANFRLAVRSYGRAPSGHL